MTVSVREAMNCGGAIWKRVAGIRHYGHPVGAWMNTQRTEDDVEIRVPPRTTNGIPQ